MRVVIDYLKGIWETPSLKRKILFTFAILIAYRFLVFLPVPFVNIKELFTLISQNNLLQAGAGGGLEYLAVLLGGTLDKFSIITVGLIPFINASIVIQLLTAVLPHLEELQEQGEVGQMKIQQYTRWLTVPFAFLQAIGTVYFIHSLAPSVINTTMGIVLLSAFSMMVWSILLMRLGETITEKWISNGISLIIFSSIVAGIMSKLFGYLVGAGSTELQKVIVFVLLVVIVLVILSILLIRTVKEIPIIYARAGRVEERAVLPIPLNPVGMIPIIFAMSFISFPYLVATLFVKKGVESSTLYNVANWIQQNMNIYTNQPAPLAIGLFFVLTVLFTFFYTIIVFNPERMAENIQQRGGYIPWIRPWEETAKYLNKILMHLSFWWGIWLALVGIYSYILPYLPFVKDYVVMSGTLPVVVSGAGIIIIVGVVKEIIDKVNGELLMERYEKL